MKIMKGIAKFLLYAALIFIGCVLLVIAGVWGYQKYKHHQLGKELEQLPVDDTLTTEHILKNHLDEKLGNNKFTVQEKLEKGLHPFKEDTSGDGLSDYEAIHTYNLDPTKFSTAEDGISDYVKIKEGLDPNEKVNSDDIDSYKITDDELGATLKTNNLNAKYYSKIKHYQEKGLKDLYKPIRDPIRVKNYEGQLTLDLPKETDNDIEAFYFNFNQKEMVKIKEQERTDNQMELYIDQDYPIYLLDSDILSDINEYYYFRVSLFQLSRKLLGFDHQIFIFKRGWFTSDTFKEDEIEDVDYGIIKISTAEIGKIYAFFLDKVFSALDVIFKPLDELDEPTLADALIDYGKVDGTPEYARKQMMPWLYEDEEIETENENSSKVVDSGFRLKHHAFPFGNFITEIADGGVCAGISRTTEFIYNDAGLETELQFDPTLWKSIARDWLNDGELSSMNYDISDQVDDYPFLQTGELFDYRFTDERIKYLSEDTFVDPEYVIKPGQLTEPDQSLIELLETQWIHSNEQKFSDIPNAPYHPSILKQLESYLADQQIIYASMNDGSGGHTVSIYKMEYDRYDPDLIRLYVYDPNLPYEELKKFGRKEVYMEIYKKDSLAGTYEYFDFNYTPMPEYNDAYSYSTENGYEIMLYHNDTPIDAKTD